MLIENKFTVQLLFNSFLLQPTSIVSKMVIALVS